MIWHSCAQSAKILWYIHKEEAWVPHSRGWRSECRLYFTLAGYQILVQKDLAHLELVFGDGHACANEYFLLAYPTSLWVTTHTK
jgi:hypothetical protein